ncbi:MAG: S53 family peptidase, partial [Polyangia bacterium]
MAILGTLALSGCMAGQVTPGEDDGDRVEAEIKSIPQLPHARVCDQPAEGFAACHARIRTDTYGAYALTATPSGLGPTQLQSAYKLDVSGGAGKTIAIVDAMDDPSAESDLATYRSTFGLPACTTANGCFKKVNQNGAASPLPKADAGWSGEIALDLDMASAICPNCKILLVEANSASMSDLGASVNRAVTMGATVVSNSYGGGESSSNASFDASYFNHPGVAIFASSGDGGYGVEYPAASPSVIAVGGTALAKSTSNARGWVESVWGSVANKNGGAGSGCSKFSAKPSYQKDTGCAKRTVADVSAVADPNTGVAVYNAGSWAVYGGTSAASPIVASTYALTGHGGDAGVGAFAYNNSASFFDVTSGANGSCGGSYLCTAGVGFDGPTGVGTPNAA